MALELWKEEMRKGVERKDELCNEQGIVRRELLLLACGWHLCFMHLPARRKTYTDWIDYRNGGKGRRRRRSVKKKIFTDVLLLLFSFCRIRLLYYERWASHYYALGGAHITLRSALVRVYTRSLISVGISAQKTLMYGALLLVGTRTAQLH